MEPTLPAWATRNSETGVITVNAAEAYPAILTVIATHQDRMLEGVKDKETRGSLVPNQLDMSKIDQYWAEVALQIMKLAVQDAIFGSEWDPTPKSALVIHIDAGGDASVKETWAQANLPEGRGVKAAQGAEVKQIFDQVRKRL